ncbi:DUF983 domain-containing protein [Flavitalea sp. BT771]|uniref:DUF983 domain-containing protein n=1 Tax=Flavitalea sp. BT771 TaxID=3063329 RepID=UPI0026E20EFE|nr:DUF983 domain-containing protein [Flavitalea sp. BT771]MDO6432222.1 DUF983 domain-containing protein [Flavitalea sp. BT771]MDV6221132.1 DUF983 domain-containing protein [Flavitalea sp. BT771]
MSKVPNLLSTILHQKCPRCREGDMFKNKNPYHLRTLFGMYDNCPVCHQRMELEPGFYYGTAYVSYSLTVAFSVSTFVAWWVLIGLSTEDNRIFWWLGINGVLLVLLQPFFMRISRTIWLSFFVKYDKHWREEISHHAKA